MVNLASFGGPALTFAFLSGKSRDISFPRGRHPDDHLQRYSHSYLVNPYVGSASSSWSSNGNGKIKGKSISSPIADKMLAAFSEYAAENRPTTMLDLRELTKLLKVEPVDLLRLESSQEDGVRGIYLNKIVETRDLLLRIPLGVCLRDDAPPSWFQDNEIHADDINDNTASYRNPSAWATRLAASVLDLQLKQRLMNLANSQTNTEKGHDLWLSFLPDPAYLRASLPVHWTEEALQEARCTALELAVDSVYFSRAEAVSDLLAALQENCELAQDISEQELTQMCHDALDVVQTRSCRAERADDAVLCAKSPLRILAPVFDFINHGSASSRGDGSANAHFGVEEDNNEAYLCVRATKDIGVNEEVLIDYGDSAKPAYKCLLSYGFVPRYSLSSQEDDTEENNDDENVAEVFLDGNRYEVGPTTVPVELVAAARTVEYLNDDNEDEESEICLSPDVALKLAKRISIVSLYLLLDDEKKFRKRQNQENDMGDDYQLETMEHVKDVISLQLAASLRWSQHRILSECAKGLKDWASQ